MTQMNPERQERMRRREQQLLDRGERPEDVARLVLEEEREADRVAARLAGQVLFAFADLARYAQLSRAFVPDPETGEMRRVTATEAALGWTRLLERFPAANFHIEVPLSAVWRAPPQPKDPHWLVTIAGRAAYREEVAASLEGHINTALKQLSYCLRTGRWWRLTAATVSVKGEEAEEPGAALAPLADPRPPPPSRATETRRPSKPRKEHSAKQPRKSRSRP